MTQIETPPRPNIDRPSPSSNGQGAWRRWIFAASIAATACVVAVIAVVAVATSGSSAAKVYVDANVPLTLTDYKVTMPANVVSTGAKTLRVSNTGAVQHELLVFQPSSSIDPTKLPVDADGRVNEDTPGLNKVSDGENIDPGQSQTRQLDLSQAGTYVFLCNLPGHYKLGMWTKVTVR